MIRVRIYEFYFTLLAYSAYIWYNYKLVIKLELSLKLYSMKPTFCQYQIIYN